MYVVSHRRTAVARSCKGKGHGVHVGATPFGSVSSYFAIKCISSGQDHVPGEGHREHLCSV